MANDSQKPAKPLDGNRPHLRLVSSGKSDDGEKGELVGFFQAFEESLMKEIEAILNL